jgi:PAS domain S-box-containing protein
MPTSGSLHILVIEDDLDTQANLRDILELEDYSVECAGSAAEALSRYDWPSTFAIILDRRLPDATADDLLPKLKHLAPDAAVLVVTGYADMQAAISALRLGANDFILKPIEPDELLARLRHVADLRRAQDAVKLAERRYRLLVQNASDIITTVDERGTIVYQNPTIERVLWYRPEDRVGVSILEDPILHPEDLPAIVAFLNSVKEVRGLRAHAECRLKHADGTWRNFDAVGQNLLGEPGIDAIVITYRDVTEWKEAEMELRRERDFAQGLISAAPAIVVVLTADGLIMRFNQFAERLTGYRAEQVLGRNFFHTFIRKADWVRVEDAFHRILDETDNNSTVGRILTRAGRERVIRWSYRALNDADGTTIRVLAIGQDITDVLAAQERALHAERLAAIGQMVTGLAHESRNALQRSQACLEMLALQLDGRPQALDLIARLQKAQDHLAHLYEDVRGYAAPIRLERKEHDLASIWRDAWNHLESQRKGRQAAVHEETDGVDLRCAVDPFRLEQVFRNLFENTLAACADPVEIDIRCDRAEIDGQLAVRIAVRDNGPGLGPESRKRIFEPFFTTKTKGTGLGMPIARRIVQAHGGHIEVGDDEVDGNADAKSIGGGNNKSRGAEIIITLPKGEP